MPEPVIHRHRGTRFRLAPERADWLVSELIPRLETLEELEGSQTVKSSNARTVIRAPLPGAVLYVKRYHVRGLYERLKYLLVPSRARAEWDAARAMSARGLPTVTALMMGEGRRCGVLESACLAMLEIPAGMDFVPYLLHHFKGDTPESGRGRRRLLTRLAALVRDFHDKGFSHQDLHSGNILVTGEPGSCSIHLIDLHKVKVGRRVPARVRRKNLAKLLFSLSWAIGEADMQHFLAAYEKGGAVLGGQDSGLGPILARMQKLRDRWLRSRSKRCLKNSSAFRVVSHGGCTMFLRREIAPETVSGVLDAHSKAVAADSPDVLKRSHRSTISKQKIAASPGGTGVVVKENLCPGAREGLKNLLRRPRGLAAWAHGNALLVRNVAVARPLAAVVERGGLLRRRSWLVMEEQSGFERLDLLVRARYSGGCSRERRQEKRRLVQGCGVFLGRLHRQGIYHADMKAMNILARFDANGEPLFRLIDYDRVRFSRQVTRRRRIKNLAQLASSIPDQVSRADRLRFFQAYAFDDDARQNLREYNRRVVALCRNRGKPAREVRS